MDKVCTHPKEHSKPYVVAGRRRGVVCCLCNYVILDPEYLPGSQVPVVTEPVEGKKEGTPTCPYGERPDPFNSVDDGAWFDCY